MQPNLCLYSDKIMNPLKTVKIILNDILHSW